MVPESVASTAKDYDPQRTIVSFGDCCWINHGIIPNGDLVPTLNCQNKDYGRSEESIWAVLEETIPIVVHFVAACHEAR